MFKNSQDRNILPHKKKGFKDHSIFNDTLKACHMPGTSQMLFHVVLTTTLQTRLQ